MSSPSARKVSTPQSDVPQDPGSPPQYEKIAPLSTTFAENSKTTSNIPQTRTKRNKDSIKSKVYININPPHPFQDRRTIKNNLPHPQKPLSNLQFTMQLTPLLLLTIFSLAAATPTPLDEGIDAPGAQCGYPNGNCNQNGCNGNPSSLRCSSVC